MAALSPSEGTDSWGPEEVTDPRGPEEVTDPREPEEFTIRSNESAGTQPHHMKDFTERSQHRSFRISPSRQAALQCGLKALQGCATMRAYTVNLAAIYLTNTAILTYVIGSYRMLEKRFNLSSREIGTLNTIADVVQIICVLFVGHFGRKAHKPRVISVSVFFYVLGAMLYAMPYFLYGSTEDVLVPGNDTSASLHVCKANQSDVWSQGKMAASHTNKTAYIFIALACVCIGLGGSCVRVMGFTYIDENVPAKETPVFVGLAGAIIPLGPILGFLLAALCTGLPENLRESHLSPQDPAYIGAWWLGFIIIGGMVFVSAIPMYLFPKHLPYYYTVKEVEKGHSGSSENGEHKERDIGPRKNIQMMKTETRGFLTNLWRLVSNITLVMFTLHSVFDILVLLGMAGNLPRYFEIQFSVPTFQANILTAVCVAIPGVLGNVLGGVIMKRYNLGVIGASIINAVTSGVLFVTLAISMGLGCPQFQVAGHVHDTTNRLDVGMSCNVNCSCRMDSFRPVCVDGHLNYLTPCHAGCLTEHNNTHYQGCACEADKVVATGLCPDNCPLLGPYILMMLISCFSIALARVPTVVLNLRIVEPDLRSFSLSIVSFADNLLGFIPAPILLGALVDSACVLWADVGDRQGACLLYDRDHYRRTVTGTCLGLQVMSLLFAILTCILVKKDIAIGKYKNLEGEEVMSNKNTIPCRDTLKGEANLAFETGAHLNSSHRASVDLTLHGSLQDLEWETEAVLVGSHLKSLDVTHSRCNLENQKACPLTACATSIGSHRGQVESVAHPCEQTFADMCMMKSSISHAIEVLALTQRYVIDVIQLPDKYSADAPQLNGLETKMAENDDNYPANQQLSVKNDPECSSALPTDSVTEPGIESNV